MNDDPIDASAHHLVRCFCTRCYSTYADYYEPSPEIVVGTIKLNGGDCYWHMQTRGGCMCDPPPALPEGERLARLVDRARRSGHPVRHRA